LFGVVVICNHEHTSSQALKLSDSHCCTLLSQPECRSCIGVEWWTLVDWCAVRACTHGLLRSSPSCLPDFIPVEYRTLALSPPCPCTPLRDPKPWPRWPPRSPIRARLPVVQLSGHQYVFGVFDFGGINLINYGKASCAGIPRWGTRLDTLRPPRFSLAFA